MIARHLSVAAFLAPHAGLSPRLEASARAAIHGVLRGLGLALEPIVLVVPAKQDGARARLLAALLDAQAQLDPREVAVRDELCALLGCLEAEPQREASHAAA